MEEEIYQKYKQIAKHYKLSSYDTRKLWNIIKSICYHQEFIKRCYAPYFHHETITLGEHILRDTVVTYQIAKKLREQRDYKKAIKLETAIYIAMFHDLYEQPWQNIKIKKKLHNKHGFVHPIEAIINAITWFPEYFKDKTNALIIIDGVIHHMYPFPVRTMDGYDLDLNNQEKFDKLPKKYQKMIEASANVGRIRHYSIRRSFFLEGRILSRADKIVALKKELNGVNGIITLVWGYNKHLEKEYIKEA